MRWLVITALLFPIPAEAVIDATDGSFSVELLRPWKQSFSGFPGIIFEAKARSTRSLIRVTRLKRRLVENELRRMTEEDIIGLDLKGAQFRTPGVMKMPLTGEKKIYFLAYRYREKEFKTGYFNLKGTSYALLTYNVGSEDWQVLAQALSVEEPPEEPASSQPAQPAPEPQAPPVVAAPVPTKPDAVGGLKACVESILDCMEGSSNKLYRPCVKKARRCKKDGRPGCCAQKCVKQFMRRLKYGKTDDAAFLEVFTYDGSCMPGLEKATR